MDAMSYYWIAGAVFVLSLIVQQKLKSTYRTWSAVRNSAGVTGAQTAGFAILAAVVVPAMVFSFSRT